MKEMQLLDTGHLSLAANMALDAIIPQKVAAGSSPATLRFLQFRPAGALVGYHQDRGSFDNKTYLNLDLIAKTVRRLHAGSS